MAKVGKKKQKASTVRLCHGLPPKLPPREIGLDTPEHTR